MKAITLLIISLFLYASCSHEVKNVTVTENSNARIPNETVLVPRKVDETIETKQTTIKGKENVYSQEINQQFAWYCMKHKNLSEKNCLTHTRSIANHCLGHKKSADKAVLACVKKKLKTGKR